MSVGEICNRTTIIVNRKDTVQEAARLMQLHGVGSLIVAEREADGNRPVGIITDRDIALKVVGANRQGIETAVEEVMENDLLTAREEDHIYDTLESMRAKGVRRLPVVDDRGILKGILTANDALDYLVATMDTLTHLFFREKEQGHPHAK